MWAAALAIAALRLASSVALGAGFTGTNGPGHSSLYSFSLGAGATNLSLNVSNTGPAFSHLLLRKGSVPDDDHFDFIAHFDGRDNRINLERPELTATNYFLAVRTPTNSGTQEFAVTLTTNVSGGLRTNFVIKPLAGVVTGTLAPGQWNYFQVEVLTNIPGWRLVLNTSGGGDADLFVRRDYLPNEVSADKSSRDRTTDTITYTDVEAQPGTYFIGVFLPATAGGNATYTLTTQLGYLTELAWDTGLTHRGTAMFTNQSATGGDYFFQITAQNPSVGVWRTALNVTGGSAQLFMSQNSLPASNSFQFASGNAGSNGFTLHASQFSAAQDWFILVTATPGAQWTLVTGDAFVQDLGVVATNGASGSGAVVIGAEGARYFKTTLPSDVPAWRLWLNGAADTIYVKKTAAPHPLNTGTFDLAQGGQMLVVPPYLLGGDSYFVGVFGTPGQTINLDSRVQAIAPLAFNTTTNFSVTGFGYATFRVQVPVEQIAWELKATPTSNNPNIAVRRNLVPNENNNDAFSEVAAPTADSLTLVPPNLSDGTFYITVYGNAPYTVSLKNGNPVITDMNYVDTRTNDDPNRVGWRYYRVPDIAQQLGTLGWDLFLSNAPPGTEIALRRNAVPGRWNYRANDNPYPNTVANVDYSGIDFLQRPGHQADIWYIGVYQPAQALGVFTLNARQLVPAPLSFNSGTLAVTNVPSGKWQFFRVDVPTNVLGWDVRLTNVTSGSPRLVLRRDRLPDSLQTVIEGNPRYGWGPSYSPSWPSGYQWAAAADWTRLYFSTDGSVSENGRVLTMGLGNPLEPGTYYVGVIDQYSSAPMSYTVQSRGIGGGLAIPVTDLAYLNGVVARTGLPAREAAYFRIIIPSNTPNWQVTLTPTNGEAMLMVEKDSLPNVAGDEGYAVTSLYGGKRVQKIGHEHFALLPRDGESNLIAGTYYLAVVSEGGAPDYPASRIGAGAVDYTVRSLGPLAVQNLGPLGAADLLRTNSLEGGELRAYQFTVSAGTPAVEISLEDAVGNPVLAARPGGFPVAMAYPYTGSIFDLYGSDGGQSAGRQETGVSTTFANPTPGTYSVIVKAASVAGVFSDASFVLRVRKKTPAPVSFDGGASVVVNQAPSTWRYFSFVVPTNALGWDLRLTNVVCGVPKLVVARSTLPTSLATSGGGAGPVWYWGPYTATNWPDGYQLAAGEDWTGLQNSPDDVDERFRIIALGMGLPLEPGTYYAGVLNTASSNATYTIASRGIGVGMSVPVVDVPFTGGVVTNTIAPLEAAYYRVIVPSNSPGWKVKLTAEIGDSLLLASRSVVPGIGWGSGPVLYPPDGYYGAGRKMDKPGHEHFVLLPVNGTNALAAGTYFLTVVGEGDVSPGFNRIGSNPSTFTLQSFGEIPIDDLGAISTTEVTRDATIESGELRAYQFTVPPGGQSIEVRLETMQGIPQMLVRPGAEVPAPPRGNWYYVNYGVDGGQLAGRTEAASVITLGSPAPGTYTIVVKAVLREFYYPDFSHFEDAIYRLHVRASGAVPIEFDGGSETVANQAAGTWRYFRVEVPTNALGWDIRLSDVTAGHPRLVVRRDQLPETANTIGPSWGWGPFYNTNWPSGYQIAAYNDWTSRPQSADNSDDESNRILAMGMGNPLEPSTYFVGVFVEPNQSAATYVISSRGIGAGFSIPVIDLNFAGCAVTNAGLVARQTAYYRVVIPPGAPSWKLDLQNDTGESLLAVQQNALPSVAALNSSHPQYPPGRLMHKPGDEHYVLLPFENSNTIPPGVYYLTVASEGINPTGAAIGAGSSAFTLRSAGVLPIDQLGAVGASELVRSHAAAGGEYHAYRFQIHSNTPAVELRLDDRVGAPLMILIPGLELPNRCIDCFYGIPDYGVDGGKFNPRIEHQRVITIPNPAPGTYSLEVKAASLNDGAVAHGDFNIEFPEASYTLRVHQPLIPALNFSSAQNTNGFSNVAAGLLIDHQSAFYRVTIPATDGGVPVVGWKLDLSVLQGSASVRVRRDLIPADNTVDTSVFIASQAIIVPPFLTPGTWFIEVLASGSTDFTLTSSALLMERTWTMPMNGQTNRPPGLVAPEFGDSGTATNGTPLPGDRGIDLAQGKLHYYVVMVPTNNPGALRVQLEAISGVPNLYVRTSAPPTLVHAPYYERSFTTTGTEYASLVPPGGTFWTELTPGPWYLAVHAGGNANVRYRLRVSTGGPFIQDLALNGGGFTNQILAADDWRYYRVQVPSNAPANWTINFQQQVGDVKMYVRDGVPPGQGVPDDNYNPVMDWRIDYKNHGPYDSFDAPGDHLLALPPVRPGAVYYLGFVAVNDATFSVSSSTSGTALFPLINFFGGFVTNTLAPNSSLTYRINVPANAARWMHTAVHSDQVLLLLEQGTIPWVQLGYYPPQHWRSYGPDSTFDRWLVPRPPYPPDWPWLADQFYFLTVTNQSASPEPFSITMAGSNTSFDGDGDGLADAWEYQHFGGLAYDGTGDQDHDGLSDLREFQLGTDPNDAASPGRFESITMDSGGAALDFLGLSGRVYRIEMTLDLQQWFTLTNRMHPGGVLQILDATATNAPQRIYRARLLP